MCSNFFFQAKKKEAKKSLGHLRLCPKPRNSLLWFTVCGIKASPFGRGGGAADGRTRIVPVHFAHGKGARLHSELEQILMPLGMEPSYDGMRIQLEPAKE